MNLQEWQQKARVNLRGFAQSLNKGAPEMIYGALATATIWPLVEAARVAAGAGDFGMYGQLFQLASSIGGNLVADALSRWKDSQVGEIRQEIEVNAADPDWQEQLTKLLAEFEAPRVVQAVLGEYEHDWFAETLRAELADLNSGMTVQNDGTLIVAGGDVITATVGDNNTGPILVGNQNQVNLGSVATLRIESLIFQAAAEPGQVNPKELLWTYLNQVIFDTGTLDLAGIDRRAASDQEQAQVELAAVYTALNTIRSEGRELRGQRKRESDLFDAMSEQQISAMTHVNEQRYAALLGDPGSGKTTFTNFIALCLAGEMLQLEHANLARLGEEWRHGALLPVRVVLRDFAAVLTGQSPQNLLWRFITQRLGVSLTSFAPLLNQHLLEHGGLLILDGLDEVPEAERCREMVKAAVIDFRRQYPRVRIVLTSRTYAYQKQAWRLPDFHETVLAPFDDEQIKTFVDNWYVHMAKVRPGLSSAAAEARAGELKLAIERNRYLHELAPRPLLLTLMASLHAWRHGRLPDDREQLYDESVELLLDIWDRPKRVEGARLQTTVAEWLKAPQAKVKRALEELAYQVHAAQDQPRGVADIDEDQLVLALMRAADDPDIRHQRVVEYIRDRAGLLINRGERIYSFPHRTFQEYMAARHLTQYRFPSQLVSLVRAEPERWREVVLLAAAKVKEGTPDSVWSLVNKLCPDTYDTKVETDIPETEWWNTLFAGQILLETEIYQPLDKGVDRDYLAILERVKGWLVELVDQGKLSPLDRSIAGVALGRLGDIRPGVGVKVVGAIEIPDIAWSELIKPGPFTMGSDKARDKHAYNDELPQFTCNLITETYQISRYPITVAQYACFTKAGGYEEAQWWTAASWEWRQAEKITRPATYREVFQTPNHPQVGISWFEAVAFCRWLENVVGFPVNLPSEAQWERAARHTDARIYPWGDEFEQNRCNSTYSDIGNTTAVGLFPTGNVPCGAADLSGNVLEWCSTEWLSNYEDYARKVSGDLNGTEGRVLRGGAFGGNVNYLRGAYRFDLRPNLRCDDLGFRVVRPGSGSLSSANSDL